MGRAFPFQLRTSYYTTSNISKKKDTELGGVLALPQTAPLWIFIWTPSHMLPHMSFCVVRKYLALTNVASVSFLKWNILSLLVLKGLMSNHHEAELWIYSALPIFMNFPCLIKLLNIIGPNFFSFNTTDKTNRKQTAKW